MTAPVAELLDAAGEPALTVRPRHDEPRLAGSVQPAPSDNASATDDQRVLRAAIDGVLARYGVNPPARTDAEAIQRLLHRLGAPVD